MFDDSLWANLAIRTNAIFHAGNQRRIPVKLTDEAGNELLAIQNLEEET
jgi:hypothetical protein